jgi:uncharacterized protein YqeY
MSLLEILNSDMKQAMRDKEKKKLSVIRMVKASLQNEGIHLGRELTSDEELTVLTRELKQRRDSFQEFSKAGRDDLSENVEEEITILTKYMPEQLSEEEIRQIVSETITEVGASSKADMGKVMAGIMPKVKGKADGALVNKLVQEGLS